MVAELNEKSDELDLIGVFALLWRRKLLVLAVAVPIAFLAGVYALLAQSVYSAEAKVLFEPSFAVVSGSGTQSINALSRMESEVQIARSEDIILNVIKDLNLVSDARFDRRGRGNRHRHYRRCRSCRRRRFPLSGGGGDRKSVV